MIFDEINIDLHFVFEGELDSPNVSHIFNNYRHAALQHRPGNHTVVGAFFLSELERRLPSYQSGPQGQNVVMTAEHTCESRRFMVHVWRSRSLLEGTWGQDSPQDEQIVVRALREGSPGQNAGILFESRPTMMP